VLKALVGEHVGIADDRVQRRAQLVRDSGEELLLQPDQILALGEAALERGA